MTPQALTALKESIAHWERVTSGTMCDGESVGAPFCALCTEFNHTKAGHRACDGCPVKERTGEQGCGKTPYEPFERNVLNMSDGEFNRWLDTPEARDLAAKELAFLESLLPVEEK